MSLYFKIGFGVAGVALALYLYKVYADKRDARLATSGRG